eukprot:scpid105834/ scgid13044/ 
MDSLDNLLAESVELALGSAGAEETHVDGGEQLLVHDPQSAADKQSTTTAPRPAPRPRQTKNLSADAKRRVAEWLKSINVGNAYPLIIADAGAEKHMSIFENRKASLAKDEAVWRNVVSQL